MPETHTNQSGLTIDEIVANAKIPTLPAVAVRFLDLAAQDEPDFAELAQVIKADPAICGRVLKTANSALLCLGRRIETIEHAISVMGLTMVRTLILGFHLSQASSNQPSEQQQLQYKLWRRFLTQAVIAELIGKRCRMDGPTCFLGGLVQDIGVFALAAACPEQYKEQVLDNAELPNVTSAENDLFGFNHVDVSVKILEGWHMGPEFIDSVKRHHDLIELDTTKVEQVPKPITPQLLRTASDGAGLLLAGGGIQAMKDGALAAWMEDLAWHFGYSVLQAEELLAEVNIMVNEYAVALNCQITDHAKAESIVERSRALLHELAITTQTELLMTQKSAKASAENDLIFRDYLTGLFNRRFLGESLNPMVGEWVAANQTFAVLYFDVDKFKTINDTYGHHVGDQAICHVADWLKRCTRDGDFPIRIGGDEFLLVVRIGEKDFLNFGNRIATGIPALETDQKETINIALSAGGVFFDASLYSAVDLTKLIANADQLMYSAKKENAGFLALSPDELKVGTTGTPPAPILQQRGRQSDSGVMPSPLT